MVWKVPAKPWHIIHVLQIFIKNKTSLVPSLVPLLASPVWADSIALHLSQSGNLNHLLFLLLLHSPHLVIHQV